MLRLEISYRGMFLLIFTLLGVWAFIELWPVILLVVIALIIMVGLFPYVEALVAKGVPRTSAVLLIFIALMAVVGGLFAVMVPPMVDEFSNVRDNLPDSAREVEELLANLGISVELQERARNIDWNSLISGRAAVDAGQRVLTTTVSIVTIIVMAAYLLADTPRLGRFIGQFIPDDRKEEANWLFFSISRVVGGYLRGQLFTSLVIALYTFLLLWIVGVPNALAFAVLAGFADVIPLVGALIAIFPPTAAALQESSTKALIVLSMMAAYQQFEDRFLIPRVYGRTLNLPPIIVLVAVLAGAELLGVTGVLLALPLAAAGRVAIDFAIEKGRLPLIEPVEEPLPPAPQEQVLAPDLSAETAPDLPAEKRRRFVLRRLRRERPALLKD